MYIKEMYIKGSCEFGYETSSSIKCGDLDWLSASLETEEFGQLR